MYKGELLTSNECSPVKDEQRLNLCHDDSRKDDNPETELFVRKHDHKRHTEVVHCENTELQVADAVTELEERQRDEE